MLWEFGQIEIGLGTLVTTNERITQAIEPSVSELSNWVKQTQPNIHVKLAGQILCPADFTWMKHLGQLKESKNGCG